MRCAAGVQLSRIMACWKVRILCGLVTCIEALAGLQMSGRVFTRPRWEVVCTRLQR